MQPKFDTGEAALWPPLVYTFTHFTHIDFRVVLSKRFLTIDSQFVQNIFKGCEIVGFVFPILSVNLHLRLRVFQDFGTKGKCNGLKVRCFCMLLAIFTLHIYFKSHAVPCPKLNLASQSPKSCPGQFINQNVSLQ